MLALRRCNRFPPSISLPPRVCSNLPAPGAYDRCCGQRLVALPPTPLLFYRSMVSSDYRASISHLPSELLLAIFAEVAGIDWLHTRSTWFSSLHLLAQVCRGWARLVLGNPELWTCVNCHHPQWRTAFRLSRSSPIAVMILYPKDGSDFLSIVSLELHRWKCAIIRSHPAGNLAALCASGATAPLLEDLAVSLRGSQTDVTSLLSGGAPRLRHLALQHTGLQKTWCYPSVVTGGHLTSLCLERVNLPSTLHFLRVVSRAGNSLAKIELRRVSFARTDSELNSCSCNKADRGLDIFELPHLRSLSLLEVQPPGAVLETVTLLHCTSSHARHPGTRIPACTRFRFALLFRGTPEICDPTLEAIGNLLRSVVGGDSSSWTQVEITKAITSFDQLNFMMYSSTSTISVDVNCNGQKMAREILSWAKSSFLAPIVACLDGPTPITLTLRGISWI